HHTGVGIDGAWHADADADYAMTAASRALGHVFHKVEQPREHGAGDSVVSGRLKMRQHAAIVVDEPCRHGRASHVDADRDALRAHRHRGWTARGVHGATHLNGLSRWSRHWP